MDYDEFQFENLSGSESIEEEEDRTSEIKQLLAQAFSNETFDDESEHSFLVNDSDQNNVNGHRAVDKNDNIIHRHNEKDDTTKKTMIENGLHSFFNGIGLDKEDGHNGGGRVNGSKKVRFKSISPMKVNDNGSSSSTTTTSTSTAQQNRGTDEIEESNPTISLLHQKHCPQNEDDEIGSDIWTESGNVVERLKTICQLRERQVQRAEENIKSLNKDKRSLNHHIGLMKTEMIQMKSCQDELQKTIELRDEEIKYLKSRMTEGIGEYEAVQKREEATKKECEGYKDQLGLYEKEVKDGREQVKFYKKEVEDCKTKLAILPSQLYKEWQQQQEEIGLLYGGNPKSSLVYNTFPGKKICRDIGIATDSIHRQSMAMQTENTYDHIPVDLKDDKKQRNEHDSTNKTEIGVAQNKAQDKIRNSASNAIATTGSPTQTFGQKVCSSAVIQTDETLETIELRDEEIKYLKSRMTEGIDKHEEVQMPEGATKKEYEGYKNQIRLYENEVKDCKDQIQFYMKEVEDWKTKLTLLPSQLYKEWQKQQEELGFHYGDDPKLNAQDKLRNSGSNSNATTGLSSLGEKESSSVVIQTDETLETYQVLGNLIEQWAKEVAESSKRAEVAEREVTLTQTKLIRLKNKFQDYHRQSLASRKKWQEQEKLLCQKYEDSRAECIAILSKVSEKLDIDI